LEEPQQMMHIDSLGARSRHRSSSSRLGCSRRNSESQTAGLHPPT